MRPRSSATGMKSSAAIVCPSPSLSRDAPTSGLVFGAWDVLYDTHSPTPRAITAAVALAVIFAVGGHCSNAGPVTNTVLVPAHNEAASLDATITSLRSQSHPPKRFIVDADKCTDSTIEVPPTGGSPLPY